MPTFSHAYQRTHLFRLVDDDIVTDKENNLTKQTNYSNCEM